MLAASAPKQQQEGSELAFDSSWWSKDIEDLDPDDPKYNHMQALKKLETLKLPAGWKRNPAKSPPYIHKDGRVSWKNPALDEIMAIAAQAEAESDIDESDQKRLLRKYQRMLSCGLSLEAVQNTARVDGMDPETIAMSLAVQQEQGKGEQSASLSNLDPREKRYLNKYERMLRSGVPLHGVTTTIRMDGFDPAWLINEDGAMASKPVFQRLEKGTVHKGLLTKKYKKMLKAGVSKNAIRSVMERDGESDQQEILEAQDDDGESEKNKLFVPVVGGVEFPLDAAGKDSHLALLVRKMALTVKRGKMNLQGKKHLKVEAKDLYDALGGLRGVQVAREFYNSTCNSKMSEQEFCSKRKPLLELLGSLGIRSPTRPQHKVDIQGLDELVQTIEATNAAELGAIQETVKVGMYDFNSLGELYKPGSRVLAKHVFASGVDMLCEVSWNRYEQGKTMFGVTRTFKVCFQFLVAVGNHFTLCEFVQGMESFEGRRSIQGSLDFIPLFAVKKTDSLLAMFRKRGEKYSKCATTQSFMGYEKGSFFAKASGRRGGTTTIAALNTPGRVMVDTQGSYDAGHSLSIASNDLMVSGIKYKYKEYMLHRRKVEQDAKGGVNQSSGDEMILFDEVPKDYLEMTWPAVVGFSFTSKTWGEVIVDGLTEITFDESIFDNLILPASRKRMVKALVRHSSDSFQDIVHGKGEGSVFLLYGPPGCGKTLTAEAISEMLHRPLYTVSLGQLGVIPDELETKLGEILDLCRRWDALILLDEADIFLEKRSSTGSLERNAMVSVMLRLVEYFKGVLFLTSNRVDALDPAFKTRITLGLRYEQLGQDARKQVWTNLLGASGYREAIADSQIINVDELAQFQLNGRDIKNAIRLGMALAEEDGVSLSQTLLLETIETLNEFNEKMNSTEAY